MVLTAIFFKIKVDMNTKLNTEYQSTSNQVGLLDNSNNKHERFGQAKIYKHERLNRANYNFQSGQPEIIV